MNFIGPAPQSFADFKAVGLPEPFPDGLAIDPHLCRVTDLAQVQKGLALEFVHVDGFGVVQESASGFSLPLSNPAGGRKENSIVG